VSIQGRFDDEDTSLRSIETGVTADTRVNVDVSYAIGKTIVSNMIGQQVDKYTFKRKDQTVPLSISNVMKVNEETISIDQKSLFQRLITVADSCDEDISTICKYELSTYPSLFFDNSGMPRTGQKSQLADAMWKLGECEQDSTQHTDEVSYVIDGGSLLQKIP